jgi:hypothetical protein
MPKQTTSQLLDNARKGLDGYKAWLKVKSDKALVRLARDLSDKLGQEELLTADDPKTSMHLNAKNFSDAADWKERQILDVPDNSAEVTEVFGKVKAAVTLEMFNEAEQAEVDMLLEAYNVLKGNKPNGNSPKAP